MSSTKKPWKMRAVLLGLSAALLLSIVYNVHFFRSSDQHTLDAYAHLRYSTVLFEKYERPMLVYLNELLPTLEEAIAARSVSHNTLEYWWIGYQEIAQKQHTYTGLIQDYVHSGRKAIEPFVENLEAYRLGSVPGSVFYNPVIGYLKGLLMQVDPTEDTVRLKETDVDKLRTLHEVTTMNRDVYAQHLPASFDPSQLVQAIQIRLQLQQQLLDWMPTAMEKTYGMNI